MKSLNVIFTVAAILLSALPLGAQQPAADGAASQGPLGGLGMFLPMVLVFGIFYLLMIRPQQKQRKQQQQMVGALKKGDEVVTTAGIHGKIHGVADNIITLEIADNIRIKLDKQQVASLKPASSS